MKAKILILGLICLFIFAYCESPANPEIEKVLNSDSTDSVGLPQATLKITTIPEAPVFTFVPSPDWDETNAYSQSQFTLIVTETNGVGGDIRIRLHWGAYYPGALWSTEGKFEPFGVLSSEINLRIYSPSTISYLTFWVDGTDDNGNSFDFTVEITCTSEEN